ncbi:hypothetical protein N0V83_004469 [Neocucurbitaria cava]|uniref:Heterokaryon incompatibility domain-containing protein n=1 Tax=Neocucurbitaria cava TaxID=798079 RepID=A0A9W9CN73_9PLEO|nr:hypothetical protein N0V83_004469 [Neocucurbitaria cava]
MSFVYKPLLQPRSIRLLHLHPAPWDEPVRCSLVLADIGNELLVYEAISYAWGDATDRKSVICDGSDVSVTRSLFEALQRFRHEDTIRVLWADAICINQQDDEEKSTQVQLMRFIYEKASKVLIWLGHEDHEKVQTVLGEICRYLSYRATKRLRGRQVSYQWRDRIMTFPMDEWSCVEKYAVSQPLSHICSAPWFGRGWVIQEVALSSSADIFWGHAKINFDLIGLAVKNAMRTGGFHTNDSANARHAYLIYLMFQSKYYSEWLMSFYSLLESTDHFAFSERKDRVYGLLGLRTTESEHTTEQSFIDPDYEGTTVDCFKKVTEKFIFEQRDFRLLSRVHHGLGLETDWPSWVPLWDKPPGEIFMNRFRGSELTTDAVVMKETCRGVECICIQGYRIDALDHQIHQYKDVVPSPSDIDQVKRVQALLRQLEGTYSAECLVSAFDNSPEPVTGGIPDKLVRYRKFMEWDPPMPQDDSHSLTDCTSRRALFHRKAVYFYNEYNKIWNGHALFVTAKGMLGLGPEAMRSGDVVVHLFCSPVPFVLRPVDGLWRLVGECYVYDVVEGSIVKELKESGMPAEKFCIY